MEYLIIAVIITGAFVVIKMRSNKKKKPTGTGGGGRPDDIGEHNQR